MNVYQNVDWALVAECVPYLSLFIIFSYFWQKSLDVVCRFAFKCIKYICEDLDFSFKSLKERFNKKSHGNQSD